ncbi:Protein angel 2 [Mortierella alpina]|uniref:Protein angel 2 n=1 Tax=Mortierella alpina TaxID=64518 RepID=A0A9P6JCB7_MORAP|nr:Protein angel 2 [Mortierella alpina]
MKVHMSDRYEPYSSSSTSTSTSSPSSSSTPSDSYTTSAETHRVLTAMLATEFNPRQWEYVGPQGDAFLSVISYNLLSQRLSAMDPKLTNSAFDSDLLLWTARMERLLNEIATYDSDIVCVQELDQGDYDGAFGCRMVDMGYLSVFKRRNLNVEHGFAVFFVREGAKEERVCIATTHVPIQDNQGGLRKLGLLMALMSAAETQLRQHQSTVFAGDFNTQINGCMINYLLSGSADLAQLPDAPEDTFKALKVDTRGLRGVVIPSSPESNMKGDALKWTKDMELRAIIRTVIDENVMTVSHSMDISSVYDLSTVVDFIFHGSIVGSRRLKVVARLELPERLALLRQGLPAGHLGSDHFAIGAKFRIGGDMAAVKYLGCLE